MIKKIISGGQSGVEMAALDAAIKLNIPHEGWCHRGKRTESGVLPEAHQLKPIEMPSYHDRLEKNIIDSDGTVILSHGQLVIGSKIIRDMANKNGKPCLHVDLSSCTMNHAASSIRKWITNNDIETVYFTGSKSVGESMIHEETIQIIEDICRVEREQQTLPGFQEKDDGTSS
jgi:hypothetical protein